MTDADLLQALRDCYDPRLHRNVVELGMVRSVSLKSDCDSPGHGIAGVPHRFVACIHLTAPGGDESTTALLRAQIENRLAGLPTISRTEITFAAPLFAIL